ncbi:DUF3800 domain-containing protein [Treponema berlinense]|uniref:DUF3800 domain-containing protein n=1 Tax=Treponema berlinense TaxID=225004 RepID=UPI0023F850FD|nr:DUF3800 domain-containing protein [Treponema berlinense]
MKTIYIDESGETIYRPQKDNKIFGLGGLIVNREEELNNLYEKLIPYLRNNELKYEDYKRDLKLYNEIISIINASGIKYHLEIVQPYLYYFMLLTDYLFFPYWIYSDERINPVKKDFYYLFQDSFSKIDLSLIKDFFLINSIEEYTQYGKIIIDSVRETGSPETDLIFEDMISDFSITKNMIESGDLQLKNIKPLPDLIRKSLKNSDVFFIYHLQCLYNFLNKYKNYNFIHDENLRLHDYITEKLKEQYPKIPFSFKDSKSEKGLIICDCITSYYTNALRDLDSNKNRELLFNPLSYNLLISNKLQSKLSLQKFRKHLSGE